MMIFSKFHSTYQINVWQKLVKKTLNVIVLDLNPFLFGTSETRILGTKSITKLGHQSHTVNCLILQLKYILCAAADDTDLETPTCNCTAVQILAN